MAQTKDKRQKKRHANNAGQTLIGELFVTELPIELGALRIPCPLVAANNPQRGIKALWLVIKCKRSGKAKKRSREAG